jgi:bacteriorhodopsin
MAELISYTLTEIALAGVGLLGLIESIRLSADNGRYNKDPSQDDKNRQYVLTALQVETAVNFIAAFVYTKMIAEYKNNPKSKIILQLRYADWVFTTPLLLLSLSMFLLKREKSACAWVTWPKPQWVCTSNEEPKSWYLGLALCAAVAMCVVGYRAELKRNVRLAVVSFVLLVAAFMLLLPYVIIKNVTVEQRTVYSIVALLWCCYGFAWFMKNEQKRNIAYNSLDLLSKVGFGLYLWIHIRGII